MMVLQVNMLYVFHAIMKNDFILNHGNGIILMILNWTCLKTEIIMKISSK